VQLRTSRKPAFPGHALQDDAVHAFELGREVAAGIPGARFVPLPGRNHMPLEGDPAASRMLHEIRLFLET
jgi:pimeloyl-ACP methyl ester carboxylesterase